MPTPVRFGTDGIRGRVPTEVDASLAYRLGRAVATVFDAPVYVGCDTRESSPILAYAVLAGLHDGGASGIYLGTFTTPGVAVIAQQRGGAGVVVSASHNPFHDNGLKVLGLGGSKLDRASEEAIERALNACEVPSSLEFPVVDVEPSAEHDYAHHLRELAPGDIAHLSIVLDCANGAASHVAHELFEGTGATVTVINDQPNGTNINHASGSTHPEALIAKVREVGADIGLAFDGDADRLIAVDAQGQLRNGDDLMILFALDMADAGTLGGGLVVTSMSNLGLHRAMKAAAIDVVETDVGDRNVLLALEEHDWIVGGEQSGHLIFRALAPTGDGMLTGLLLCELVARRGPLADLCDAAWAKVPQVLVNIDRGQFDEAKARELFAIASEKYQLDPSDVRLLIRSSGTEPLERVMVEALDGDFVEEYATALRDTFHVH
jgi:phosphoglucosamine mutase